MQPEACMRRRNSKALDERTYCPANHTEVWVGQDPTECPETELCPSCAREVKVTPREEKPGHWVARVPVHPLQSLP